MRSEEEIQERPLFGHTLSQTLTGSGSAPITSFRAELTSLPARTDETTMSRRRVAEVGNTHSTQGWLTVTGHPPSSSSGGNSRMKASTLWIFPS